VIDSDLGVSADRAAIADRDGFRELAGEVALGNVGLILGHPSGPTGPRQFGVVWAA